MSLSILKNLIDSPAREGRFSQKDLTFFKVVFVLLGYKFNVSDIVLTVKEVKGMRELFGTDGIRGLANTFPMTGEIAMAVGKAIAYVLRTDSDAQSKTSLPVGLKPLESRKAIRRAKMVIGKDTRLSGYMIEDALASGICAMGTDVYMMGPISTPGVAFVTHSMRADAGIMISASHNPYHDNGIKIFSHNGYKFTDKLELEIERLVLTKALEKERPTADLLGKAFKIEDARGRYLVYLKSQFPEDLDLLGTRVALDCANGAAYKVAPMVFEELGAEVIKIGVSPNGLNINDKCGALHPENIAGTTAEYRADIGIAIDGDGDRCILSDENGEILDGDQIIGLCAIHMIESNILKQNTVVTTPMSNIGLENTLKNYGISMIRAQVGDRHVIEEMRKNGFNLGGEQSGHIIFLDHATTGDGILAALKILEIMRRKGEPLSELKKLIKICPQVLKNVRVSEKKPFNEIKEIKAEIEKAEKLLKDVGRIFVRYSGTEPVARVMVEGEDKDQIEKISRKIVSTIQHYLG